jgi:SAM-dependent methyltransferase
MKYVEIIKRLSFVRAMPAYIKLSNWRHFIGNFRNFRKLSAGREKRFNLNWKDIYPCLGDRTPETSFERDYVYHVGWAARILADLKPEFHVDISSSLYFCSVVSAFIPVKFYDFRPAALKLSHLSTDHADLVSLPFEDRSIHSLSCMHVVEHVGLGRYGDTLNPDGDLQAIGELQRVLATGGSLLFVVPVGRPKIMFDAHRIYSYKQILRYFGEIRLEKFALIPDRSDSSGIIYDASQELADAQDYGCGCFWFKK